MANVAQLSDYRARQANDPAECRCGSVWFTLLSHNQREDSPGAVMINREGSVVGRAGMLRCATCGASAPGA